MSDVLAPSGRWVLLSLALLAACGSDDDANIEGAASATDGEDGDPDRGWRFACLNNDPAPNYYWRLSTDIEDCVDVEACWVQDFMTEGLTVCINATNVPNFDPSNWMTFQAGIREECSARCVNRNGYNGFEGLGEPPDERCLNGIWTSVAYDVVGQQPDQVGSNCWIAEYVQLQADRYGNNIVWAGGTHAPVHCNLYNGQCDSDFDALVYPWVSELYGYEDIASATRRADYLGVSSTSKVTFTASTGTFVLPLNAMVEYSAPNCPSAGCPFYLANVEATQIGAWLAIRIPNGSGYLSKRLSNFKVDLMHSAWGIRNKAQNKFVMTTGTVALRVKYTLVNTDGNPSGDGSFENVMISDSPIFGDSTTNGIDSVVFEPQFIPGVNATIDLDQANRVDFPPVVSSTLPNSVAGCVSLASYVSATDPDGDVDMLGWIVDDEVMYDEDVVLHNGTYSIAPAAIDTRGAVDTKAKKQFTVSGCP